VATRTPQTNYAGQVGVRSRANGGGPVDDGTVFSSMKEFWLWVTIVTLIIFSLMIVSFAIAYQSKQLKQAEALLVRIEEKERKQKLLERKDDE
jgi:predicted membrane protein